MMIFIDKFIEKYRIPVTITVVLSLQSFAIIAYVSQWVSTIGEQLEHLGVLIRTVDLNSDRILRLEEQQKDEIKNMDRINRSLDKLIELHMQKAPVP